MKSATIQALTLFALLQELDLLKFETPEQLEQLFLHYWTSPQLQDAWDGLSKRLQYTASASD